MGSVLLITFEVFVLHIVPDPLCTSIGSIVFKCEGKDTNLFSIIQIFNAEKDHGVGSSDHFQESVILIMIHYCLYSHIICLDK